MGSDIDIFNPQVSRVAHGLEGKTIMLYGTNNVGKTYQAVRMPKPYVFACESGLGAQNNVRFNKINDWREFKLAVSQFTNPKTIDQAKELYNTIIIDEIYASSLFCQKFICDTYGGGCISFGANENTKVNLYQIYERIYWEQINKLVGAGYTVVFIAHEQDKDNFIFPQGDKRCLNPIVNNCDLVVYLKSNGVDENGNVIKSSAFFAQTSEFFARSRYDYMVTSIPEFTVDALEKAISDGIEKQAEAEGVASITFAEQVKQNTNVTMTFDEAMDAVGFWGEKLDSNGHRDVLMSIIENTLGVGHTVSSCSPKQLESICIIVDDLKEACDNFHL